MSFFFYRDGIINFNNKNVVKEDVINKYLKLEYLTITNFIYNKIMEKCLGWLNREHLNKITQLTTAKKSNLNIPYFKY